jgi:hypothetical protein
MRIHFRNHGHANWYLKNCKRLLTDTLIAAEGIRLPSQRARNAICRGIGYSSYDDLKRHLDRRSEIPGPSPSREDLIQGLSKSFSLALDVAHEYHFRHEEDTGTLSLRLTRAAVEELAGGADDSRKVEGALCDGQRVRERCKSRVVASAMKCMPG